MSAWQSCGTAAEERWPFDYSAPTLTANDHDWYAEMCYRIDSIRVVLTCSDAFLHAGRADHGDEVHLM
jgi:hypothetical protein